MLNFIPETKIWPGKYNPAEIRLKQKAKFEPKILV